VRQRNAPRQQRHGEEEDDEREADAVHALDTEAPVACAAVLCGYTDAATRQRTPHRTANTTHL
jgi:hypothetical protein